MLAYKETITLDDLQRLQLAKPLPLRKGQRVEVLILVADEDPELEQVRTALAARGVTEADVQDALAWARNKHI